MFRTRATWIAVEGRSVGARFNGGLCAIAADRYPVKITYIMVSFVAVLLGCGFVIDSLDGWDDFAVVAAIAGWAVVVTGALHLLVALGREGNDAVRWLAVASGGVLTILVVSGWTFATFAREWPEVSAVVCLAAATGLAFIRRDPVSTDAQRDDD